MARIARTAAAKPAAVATDAKPAKVGKLDKAAKAATAKPTKPAAAIDPDKAPAPRGQYAGRKYHVTEAGKAAAPRGNRGARWAIVSAHRNTADVLGKPYTRADGAEGTITSSGLRNFVARGFVEFDN